MTNLAICKLILRPESEHCLDAFQIMNSLLTKSKTKTFEEYLFKMALIRKKVV